MKARESMVLRANRAMKEAEALPVGSMERVLKLDEAARFLERFFALQEEIRRLLKPPH